MRVITYICLRCPSCRSPRVRTYCCVLRGAVRVRWHLCRACGGKFKTHEVTTP